ncbi:ParA family protein [Microvirga puerhi]|uniref:ParA family protein n=1 Tax=Microvirga puerhi TaxID=2876078 RepID=A0ABS7VVM8_9HYPH|nr:ParA family protein [Microvirga puerhi]MBZ6078923.1 ParA family protein [Microvirga puerhi]
MPVISFSTPKGGVGKSTAAMLLGQALAHRGAKTFIVDTDKNHSIAGWSARGGSMPNLQIKATQDAEEVVDIIEAEREQNAFTIVDVEGIKSMLMSNVIICSDFVIMPMRETFLDAKAAKDAAKLTLSQRKVARRDIPFRLLLSQTGAIKSREQKDIIKEVRDSGLPMFKTELALRTGSFAAIFSHTDSLFSLDPKEIRGLKSAQDNAMAFADEVIAWARQVRAAEAGDNRNAA